MLSRTLHAPHATQEPTAVTSWTTPSLHQPYPETSLNLRQRQLKCNHLQPESHLEMLVTLPSPAHLPYPTWPLPAALPPAAGRLLMQVGLPTERSESSEAWSEERVRQLEEDKAAIERLWGEHAQENDIGVLKYKLVCVLAVFDRVWPHAKCPLACPLCPHEQHLLHCVGSRDALCELL